MKKKIFFTIVFVLVFAILVFGVWSMLKSNKNNKLFKLIEQQKTNDAIALISKMSEDDVNECYPPLFLKRPLNILTQGMRGPQFPLVKACEYGNYDIIEALLKKGADPNKFVDGGWSPIEAVFVKGHSNRLEIAKLLIEYGADPNLCGSGTPALFLEAGLILWKPENEELSNTIISLLIDSGARPVNNKNNYSILHYSVHGNCSLITDNLINSYHLPIDTINNNGQTPLMMSVKNNAIDTAKLLLDYGADKSVKDNNGKTVYDLAAEVGNVEMNELLRGDRGDGSVVPSDEAPLDPK